MPELPEYEISSSQVVFPNNKTLDEVYASLTETIKKLTSRVKTLEDAATATE